MKIKKELILVGISFLIFILSLILYNYGSFDLISGNVIITAPAGSCDNASLKLIWENIFKNDSEGLFILKNETYSGSNCPNYLLWKNVSDEYWVLSGESFEHFGGVSRVIMGYYLNGTSGIGDYLNSFSYPPTYYGLYFSDDLINNRTTPNISEANKEYHRIFKTDNYTWYGGNYNSFSFSEYGGEDTIHLGMNSDIYKNKSRDTISISFYNLTDYNPPKPILKQNISDYSFGKNCGWKELFDADDYFDSNETLFYSYYLYSYNSNITYVFDKENKMSIKPSSNFTGTERLRIRARGIYDSAYSNWFNVTIVEKINSLPYQKEKIGDIELEKGENKTLNLSDYYFDDDGDLLKYRVSSADAINVSVKNEILKIVPPKNFTGYFSFFIYVNDTYEETEGDKVRVYVIEKNITLNITNTYEANLSVNEKPRIVGYGDYEDFNFTYGEPVYLYVNVTDLDNDDIIYNWFVNGNLTNKSDNYYNSTSLEPGKYKIRVEASDGKDSVSKTWDIMIKKPSKLKWVLIGAIVFIVLMIILLIVWLILHFVGDGNNKRVIEFQEQQSNIAQQEYMKRISGSNVSQNQNTNLNQVNNLKSNNTQNILPDNNSLPTQGQNNNPPAIKSNEQNVNAPKNLQNNLQNPKFQNQENINRSNQDIRFKKDFGIGY